MPLPVRDKDLPTVHNLCESGCVYDKGFLGALAVRVRRPKRHGSVRHVSEGVLEGVIEGVERA